MNGLDLRQRMVDRLERNGGSLLAPWCAALLAVPRHVFVPEVFWHGTSSGYLPLHRSDDPDAWLGMAYSDGPLVVQVDDGRPDGVLGRCPSSTMLSPYDLSRVLSTVDAQPGMRVCEVGTGTGYTAAVLAHRLGADAVTTIEVDPALVRLARRRLRSAGFGGVTVVRGDGTHGHPPGAPYDRLVSSATVRAVPYSWVEQVRPEGLIVTSWGTPYHGEALLRLTVRGGGSAVGGIVAPTHCEWERGQRVHAKLNIAECEAALARVSTTKLDVNEIAAGYDISVAIGLRVPNCASVYIPPDDQWFVDPGTGSWARLHVRNCGTHLVNQYGPRNLWDEVAAAHDWWYGKGCPPASAWRFTVTREGTSVDLVNDAFAAIAV